MATVALSATAFTSADVGVGTGIGGHATGIGTSDDGKTQVKASATYTGVLTGNGIEVVGECDAVGIGAVASTAIVECYLVIGSQTISLIDQEVGLPGNAVAIAGTEHVDGIPTKLCVRAEARPILGSVAKKLICAEGAVGLTVPDGPLQPSVQVTAVAFGPTFGCVAQASGVVAVAIEISHCAYGDVEAPRASDPGPFAATAASGTYAGSVCYEATAFYSDGATATVDGCSLNMFASASP